MRQIIFFVCMLVGDEIYAQQQSLKGFVYNDQSAPVEFATVALLNPLDTTLENFAFSAADGSFEIKNVAPATYILQISFVGYATFDTIIKTPLLNPQLGIYILKTQDNLLDEVEITGERSPLQIKGDTIEYNAGAFKTQPDATAEDLLKKLPGIEVDESGNIKAQGEDVQQVLVDGKEFFSNDPAVATKNLPADAIDKVQVYDKSSDESEFTGVDDGSRSKTINLMLKDGKKSMWLGNAQAGTGTDEHYQASAKLYRFTKENQVAALGMLNNINQFGFSINDYIDFSGGIGAMMSGGGFRIESGSQDNMPVNFGQSVDGLITSGAAGFNFTREVVPGNRLNFSYLGNGYQKHLIQYSETENFLPGFNYNSFDTTDELTENYYHRLNFNIRNKPDSMQSIITTGNISFNTGENNSNLVTENYSSDSLTTALNSENFSQSNSLSGTANLNYIHKTTGNWPYLKLTGGISASSTISDNQWHNITNNYDPIAEIDNQSYQDNDNALINYNLTLSAVHNLAPGYYYEPFISAGGANENYIRKQGNTDIDDLPVDSLSPEFSRLNYWAKPGIIFKYSSKSTQWRISLGAEGMNLSNTLNDAETTSQKQIYFIPQIMFEKEIRTGRHIRLGYETTINAPVAIQLLPVADYINPLSVYEGNPYLKPEYISNLYFNWILFDQFSFTSLFTHLNFQYTQNKINYSKTIYPDFSEKLDLVNTPYDINARTGFDFSTPVRPVKLNVHLEFNETYDRGINYINDEENTIDAFTHDVSLSFDNRGKDLVDILFGGSFKYTQASYSVDTNLSTNYFTSSLFTGINITPTPKWNISFDADIDRYFNEGTDQTTTIPMLKAEVSYSFLKSNRAMLILKGYDPLNKNSGIDQVAAYNYISTVTSNSISRYFMLSFKYRINKTEQNNGVDVKIN